MTLFGDEHVRRYQETDGAEGYHWKNDTTILLLTTTGRKSGEDRTNALIYRDWEDKQLIVASKGGADTPPAWFLNLEKRPEVTVQIKDDRFSARARVANDDEKASMWEHMVQVWPDYANYQARTDRPIPVIVLERVA
ncbi:MAG: nitroreductase family deazaflavin-dependent oxidoreductase [Jatrophihabitantaceae bacterium]